MDGKDPLYVLCRNGVFVIPETLHRSLARVVTNGFVYLREDADVLTISTRPIVEGRRRLLSARFRSFMFRGATRLAIVDLKESIRVMAVT